MFGPVPGDDVVVAGCDEQAAGVGVGAVDEDLVVDAVGVWGIGHIDKPQRGEPAVERAPGDVQGVGHVG